MKILDNNSITRLYNKPKADDKYIILSANDIIGHCNDVHPEHSKELYKSICIPSYVNSYSLCIEYMRQWFLSKLPPHMFEENSVNIDGKNIFDDYRKLTRDEILARKKPMLTITPNVSWDFDNEKIDTHPYGLDVYSPLAFWKGSFFRDDISNMYMGLMMKVMLMTFQFKIRVETKAEQMDLYEYMKLAYRISYSTGEYADLDIHIPYDLMLQIAHDKGFEICEDNKRIKNIPLFLKYLNQNSDLPFVYKYRTISGNPEFFIRMSGLYIHIKPQSLDVDDGETEGKMKNNYMVTYDCEVRFPAPRMYSYYSVNTHNLFRLFNANDTKLVYGNNSIVNFATFKITDIPETNKYGWKIMLTTDYDNDNKNDKLKIDFSELFEGDILACINHSTSTGVSPDMWMHILLLNNGKPIEYEMDWIRLELNSKYEVENNITNIVIYVDQSYLNDTVLFLKNEKNNRISPERIL